MQTPSASLLAGPANVAVDERRAKLVRFIRELARAAVRYEDCREPEISESSAELADVGLVYIGEKQQATAALEYCAYLGKRARLCGRAFAYLGQELRDKLDARCCSVQRPKRGGSEVSRCGTPEPALGAPPRRVDREVGGVCGDWTRGKRYRPNEFVWKPDKVLLHVVNEP